MSKIAEHYLGDKSYPDQPGYKVEGPSRDAAVSMAGTAVLLREQVFAAIAAAHGGLTADEAAEATGQTILAVRPRCTELQAHMRIKDSGIRRKNVSGRKATVWVRR